MADFIRPEARAAIWKWRDVLVAAGMVALGLWWVLVSGGILYWLGIGLIVLGLVLGYAGAQRARFRQGDDGPGVVSLDEGRLTYFGPLTGGAMDIADLTEVVLDPTAHPAPHWVLTDTYGRTVAIPVNAAGGELLFDAFARLPGIRTGAMLAALETPPDSARIIWAKPPRVLH